MQRVKLAFEQLICDVGVIVLVAIGIGRVRVVEGSDALLLRSVRDVNDSESNKEIDSSFLVAIP